MNMIIYQLEHTDNLEFHLNYINMIIWNNKNIHDYFNQNNFYSHIITIIENKALEKLNIQQIAVNLLRLLGITINLSSINLSDIQDLSIAENTNLQSLIYLFESQLWNTLISIRYDFYLQFCLLTLLKLADSRIQGKFELYNYIINMIFLHTQHVSSKEYEIIKQYMDQVLLGQLLTNSSFLGIDYADLF